LNKVSEIKIVIIPSWYPPEGGGFFKEHAEMLPSEEFRVNVLVNRIIGLTSHSLREIITEWISRDGIENSIFVSRSSLLKVPWMEEWNMKRWIKKSLKQFEKFCKKNEKPDIIIAHCALYAGVVAERIKAIYGIPFILIEHRGRFILNNEYSSSFLKNWHRNFYIPAYKGADKIICVSDSLMEGIREITRLPEEKFAVIANQVNSQFFDLPLHSRESPPFIFLSIGMLEKVKGFDILLKAFAEFTDALEGEFFLRIGGKGSLEKELKLLAMDLGISDRVSFLGYISKDRVRDEMQRSNVFVSSSRFESFGVVLAEAAMTGLPLIATRSGGPQSIVNEVNGILLEPENPSELEKVMEKMYFDYLNFIPEFIRQNAVDKYDSKIIISKYHSLIKDVING
jgi:glycosyltransferase involved in cell wall biosynthesis